MNKILKKTLDLINQQKRKKNWLRATSIFAALVIFATTYALILPALTMEEEVAMETPGIVLEQEAPAAEQVAAEPAPEPEPAAVEEPAPEPEPAVVEEPAPEPEPAAEEPAPEPEAQTPAEAQTQAATEVQTQAPAEAQTQAATEVQTQAPTDPQIQEDSEAQTPVEAEAQVSEKAESEQETAEKPTEDTEAPTEETETESETKEVKALQEFTAHENGLKVKVTLDNETKDYPETTQLRVRQILRDNDGDLFGASREKILEWVGENEDYELDDFAVWALVFEADGQRISVDKAAKVEFKFDQPIEKNEDEISRIFIYRYPGQDRQTGKPDFNLETEENKIRGCRFHTDSLVCDAFVIASAKPVEEETEGLLEETEEETEELVEDPEEGTETILEEVEEGTEELLEEESETPVTIEQVKEAFEQLAGPMVFEEQTQDVAVTVSAVSGTFPAGTTMEIVPVEAQDYADAVGEAVEGKVSRMVAVDIIFRDADGNEIEPARPVSVKMQSALIEEEETPVVVHVDDQGSASVVEGAKEFSEDELIFHSEEFSVYILVGTETISTQVITAEGSTYTIEVTYGPEAEIPEGAQLIAKEIVDEEAYNNYLLQAEVALSDEDTQAEISFARFFDIEIKADGEKIEPKAPVEVKIINTSAPDIKAEETMNIVHFADKGTEVIKELSISEDGKEITYNQNGFSVTGEVAGTFSGNNWPSSAAGDYVLVVHSGNAGPYYAVNSSGGLVEIEYNEETGKVTFPDELAETTEDLSDYWWTYFVSGGNHRLTSVANPNNKIYPQQTDGGSALTNTTNSPGANQGYIYRGSTYNRYCVAINNAGTSLISSHVTYQGGYTYPGNAAHFIFVNQFEDDVTGAYGTAESIILTGNNRTLRIAEVTTSDESLIDFEGFTWRSTNTSVATVSTDPDTDAPIATAVAVGTTRIIGTRTNGEGELDEVVWTVTVKDKTNNSIVFLHQTQDNANFATQDNYRPHEGYGNTEPTNYVKFVVALADEDGNILLYNGKPNVELPAGSVVPERYEFELDSSSIFAIEEDTLSGISVPGYSYAGTYAYFGWYNNTDLQNMAVVSEFKNMGAISTKYPNYYSVLGFKTSRGNPGYQDYSQTAFGERGNGYYAYNPTGVLMIVLQPVSEDIAYRTSYHNDYVPGGAPRINIVQTTDAKMVQGEWIPDEYRHDWYGETIMTTLSGSDLTPPADGYEFVGWFDAVDSEGNGTGNQVIGQAEDGYFYAMRNGEKIIIRQNNDIYAKWQLVRGTLRIQKVIEGDLSEAEMTALKSSLNFTVTDDTTQETITKTGSEMTWNGTTGTIDVTGLSAATTYTVIEDEDSASVGNYDVTTDIENGEGVKVSKTGVVITTITNTYEKETQNVTFTKTLEASQITGDTSNVTTAVFTLSDGTNTYTKSPDASGTVTFEDVPYGTYTLTETTAPAGYKKVADHTVEVTADGFTIKLNGTDIGKDEVYSIEDPKDDTGSITLVKTDKSGTQLSGASFEISPFDDASSAYRNPVTHAGIGSKTISDLTLGTKYQLKEVIAPDGYILLGELYYFQIKLDGTVEITSQDGTVITDYTNLKISLNGTTISVKNEPGKVLPSTGGNGTLLYKMIGLLIILASILMYGLRMRRRERRFN